MKHSLVRQTIVETASELFYQNGYNLTGINEIIKEAGVAKATLYNHFKSKEEICIAYLDYKHVTFISGVKSFVESRQVGKEKLLGLFDFLEAFFEDKDFNGCWCINTVSEIPKENVLIRKRIQEQKQELIQLIKQWIDEGETNGTLKAKPFLESQVYLLYEGAVSESYLHQQNWPIGQARKICEQII